MSMGYDRGIIQVARLCLLTTEFGFEFRANSCEIYGESIGSKAEFPPRCLGYFLRIIIPPLYRAIGLVLDFIHRLVCGRQKLPQRFGDWICLRPQVDGAG
jgi:hypothetical protein